MPAYRVVLLVVMAAGSPALLHAEAINPAGKELARFLDGMHVEKLWPPKETVDWKTGKPSATGKVKASHCSAFVAAACERKGVYILRPPDHSETFLASAQHDWLLKKGSDKGWERVKSMAETQRLANAGLIVVASYKEPEPKKPGHIAIVRPSTKSAQKIAEEGPQIIQAGGTNYNSTSLKEGFKRHPGAFQNREILFFVHKGEKP